MGRLAIALVLGLAATRLAGAADPPQDPNLPSARPAALQALSDDRARQKMMLESQAAYPGRCVCAEQTRDSKGGSCKGRHEVVKTRPVPLCRPAQVTPEMLAAWRRSHP